VHDIEEFAAARIVKQLCCDLAIIEGNSKLPFIWTIDGHLIGQILGFLNVSSIERRT